MVRVLKLAAIYSNGDDRCYVIDEKSGRKFSLHVKKKGGWGGGGGGVKGATAPSLNSHPLAIPFPAL